MAPHSEQPNVVTSYWAKPIPLRQFDWEAIDDNTFDGPGSHVGYGATAQEAVADLLEQIGEAA